jgi:hypothetical protein
MERMKPLRVALWTVAAVATLASVVPAYAQTQGMERRQERRDDRAGARAAKQECKAGDEKTRAECRQEKRATKQEGWHDGGEGPPRPRQARRSEARAGPAFKRPRSVKLKAACTRTAREARSGSFCQPQDKQQHYCTDQGCNQLPHKAT